jgi:hypothetical protein
MSLQVPAGVNSHSVATPWRLPEMLFQGCRLHEVKSVYAE